MNPRKVIDDFSVEEPILEPTIVIPDDQLAQPSEMFPAESQPTASAQRSAVLDLGEPSVIQPPSAARAPRMVAPGPAPAVGPRPRGSILRSASAVGFATILIGLAVIGGAAVRNGLNVSALSDRLAVLRRIAPPLPEFERPTEVSHDSAAPTGSGAGTTGGWSATVAETNSVSAPTRLEDVEAAPPPPPPAKSVQPSPRKAVEPTRPSVPPRAGRAAVSPPTSRAPIVVERGQESRPQAAPAVSFAAPSVPAVSYAPAVPDVSLAPPLPVTSVAPAPSPSPAVAPPAAVAAPAVSPTGLTTETRAVALALNRYEDAFSALDVSAAHAVWPSVDARALAKAFDQLETQTFDLEGCNITVTGAQAEADCAGNARYVRKVGNRALRVEPRRWHFTLRQSNDQWLIDTVDAR